MVILGAIGDVMLDGEGNGELASEGGFGSWRRMTRNLLGVNNGYMRGNARF